MAAMERGGLATHGDAHDDEHNDGHDLELDVPYSLDLDRRGKEHSCVRPTR